jgi:hypothetical protein
MVTVPVIPAPPDWVVPGLTRVLGFLSPTVTMVSVLTLQVPPDPCTMATTQASGVGAVMPPLLPEPPPLLVPLLAPLDDEPLDPPSPPTC